MAGHDIAWALPARPVEVQRDRYLPELEGLRGLAMLLVLAAHTDGLLRILQPAGAGGHGTAYALIRNGGDIGVGLFFVLSSFLLSLPFVRAASPAPSLRRYAERRALRILPLYYAAVLVAALVTARQPTDVLHGVPYLFFLNALPDQTQPLLPFSGVWWSLATEVEFYIALGLLAWLSRRRGGRALVASLLAAYAVVYGAWLASLWSADSQWLMGFSIIGRGPFFLAGWLAAVAYARYGVATPSAGQRWSADAAVLLVVIAVALLARWVVERGVASQFPPWHGYHVVEAIFCGVLVWVLAATPTHARSFLASRTMQLLGILSYSIYVWHDPILGAVIRVAVHVGLEPYWGTWHGALVVAGAWSLCLAVSLVTYHLIERPFLQRKQRLAAG